MSRLVANLLLLLTAAIWGSAFIAQSTAMRDVGPILFTGLRFLVAAVAVLPFALVEGRRPADKLGRAPISVRWMGALTLVFMLGQLTQQIGIKSTTVTNAGFLTSLYVVLVPIFGVLLFRQRQEPLVWPAALVALAGTWLLSGGLDGLRPGDLWVMLSTVFWALQVLLVGKVAGSSGRPVLATFIQSIGGGIAATALALLLEPASLPAIGAAAPELLYAGAVSGGLAFSLQAVAQRHTGAADAAVVFSSEAVFAAIAAALLLGERLSASGWAGSALILAAVVLVQLVPALRPRPKLREG